MSRQLHGLRRIQWQPASPDGDGLNAKGLRQVFASMEEVAYSVTATLSMNSGFILNATCQCKCAVLGRYSQVAGQLQTKRESTSRPH